MAVPGTTIPWAKPQFFTDNGEVAAGYFLWTYYAGTTEQAITYSDKGFSTENSNPITLDSAGRASIFFDRGYALKFILTESGDTDSPPQTPVWTQDNILSVPFYGISDTETRASIDQVAWGESDSTVTLQAPYPPVILYSKYVGGSTSDTINIPAGTLTDDDALILEWETDYSSATLSSRATMFGSNVDQATGAASTMTRARYIVSRQSNTTLAVATVVLQNTGGGNAQVGITSTTIGSLDLDATDYTIVMTMASGTFTVRGARCLMVQGFENWTGL